MEDRKSKNGTAPLSGKFEALMQSVDLLKNGEEEHLCYFKVNNYEVENFDGSMDATRYVPDKNYNKSGEITNFLKKQNDTDGTTPLRHCLFKNENVRISH